MAGYIPGGRMPPKKVDQDIAQIKFRFHRYLIERVDDDHFNILENTRQAITDYVQIKLTAYVNENSLPLSRYAATYRDAWYGDVVIALEGKRLVMRFAHTAQLVGELEHWQHDTFLVRWHDRALNADAFASFALDPDGKVRELRMQAASSLTDFSFDFHHLRLLPQAGDD